MPSKHLLPPVFRYQHDSWSPLRSDFIIILNNPRQGELSRLSGDCGDIGALDVIEYEGRELTANTEDKKNNKE